MSLANYTDLKASVATWLNRADLTATIPDFILAAEQTFNDTLRVPGNEQRITFTLSSEYATVPNDWLEFRSGYIDTDPRTPLEYLPPEIQTAAHSSTDTRRVYFSIAGNEFRFDPLTTTGDVVMLYYAKIPPLALNATNWLLTRAPMLYLYEACFQGSVYIQDDDRAMRARQLADGIRAQFTASGRRARWSGPAMVARPG